MFDFITKPFGVVMEFIYTNLAFHNYGIAIILFTLFTKILLLPLSVKQQKSTERQQLLVPEIEALKQSCGGDQKKFQQQQAELYSKYNINPLSGCLPTLIQFPLIIILYKVIQQPLTYISGLASTVIDNLKAVMTEAGLQATQEISINGYFLNNVGALAGTGASESDLINMSFLKIFNLGETPQWKFWEYGENWKIYLPLLIIPFLAVGSSYLLQWATNKMNGMGGKKDQAQAGAMGIMLKLMPLMTFFFAFALPAGLGFYWTVSNLFGIAQTFLIKKVFSAKIKSGK